MALILVLISILDALYGLAWQHEVEASMVGRFADLDIIEYGGAAYFEHFDLLLWSYGC